MSKIILKKSAVAGKQPTTADLEYGELALNYADSKLFFKKVDNTIGTVGGTNINISSETALQNRYSYVASAGESSFAAVYIAPYVDVFLNGLRLSSGVDYSATSGTAIILTLPAVANDLVEIVATTSYTVGLDTALQNRYNYTATALQTSFVATYIPGYVDVYKNGVKLNFLEDFTASNGSQVVLATACAVGDLVEIIATTSVAAGNAATATTATNVLGGTANVTALTTSGNLTFSGTNNRITGDFSNATIANRVAFQTSIVNGRTGIGLLPNGTEVRSDLILYNSSDTVNNSFLDIFCSDTQYAFSGNKSGTGTYLPMIFYTGGSERVRIDTSGNVGIGTNAPVGKLDIVTGTNRGYFDDSAGSLFRLNAVNAANSAYAPLSLNGSVLTFQTNASERMRIDSSGQVGIGFTPNASQGNLQSWKNITGGLPATTGTTDANQVAVIGGGSVGLRFGLYPAGGFWLQNSSFGNFAVNYDFVLQPNGGNVGVGTAAPAAKLDIGLVTPLGGATWSGGTDFIKLTALSGSAWAEPSIAFHETGSNIGAKISGKNTGNGAMNIIFANRDGSSLTSAITERMRIDTSGNLLVGTTSSLSTGTHSFINTSGGSAPLTLRHASSTAGRYWFAGPDNASNFIVYNNSSIGVYLNYGATSWSASSDERVKDILEPITDASNKVSSLRTVIGKYKRDTNGTRRAFLIAQDVQAVLPEAVNVQSDEMGTLGIQYTDVIPLLVAAFKEQQAIITALAARVAALESN
jgi:hypothetical protein